MDGEHQGARATGNCCLCAFGGKGGRGGHTTGRRASACPQEGFAMLLAEEEEEEEVENVDEHKEPESTAPPSGALLELAMAVLLP